MKRTLYLCAGLLFAVMLSSSKARSQTIISHDETHYCDSVFFYMSASGGTGLTAEIFYGDGTSNTGVIDTMYTFAHGYHTPGIYTVKEVLYNLGAPVDSVSFSDSIGFCATITLVPYLDNNGNCVSDAGDNNILAPYTVEIDSAGIPLDTITATAIHYITSDFVPAGTIYAFKVLAAPAGAVVSCPVSGIVYDTVGTSFGSRMIGFNCSGGSGGFDLSETVDVGGPGRHMADAHVIINNSSCTPQGGTLTMTFSPKYNFTSAYPVPTTVAGNVITWDFTGVTLVSPVYINAHFDVPGAWLIPGDTIHSSYVVTPTTGDINPTNNSCVRVDTVTSSYDPNAKSVTPSGYISAGTNLNYMIAFENTGNAAAVNIHIQDTLSDDVDMNSFKLQNTTALVYTTFSKDGAGHNIVKFDFPGINLPDSSHHNQCEGMVTFTINSKTGLANGTVIDNRAGIYFDDNEVVMTNTAEDVIGGPLHTAVLSNAGSVNVYPNPVADQLTIKAEQGDYTSMQITNAIGQVIMKQALSGTQTNVNVSRLVPGIYQITLRGESGVKVVKFEKM